MQWCGKGIGALAASLLAAAAPAAGEAGDSAARADAPVPLERLLELPPAPAAPRAVARRGGATRPEWQARFAGARRELEKAREDLVRTRAELEQRAGEVDSSWTMTAPGLGDATKASEAPLDYRLSQDLRRFRDEERRAEAVLQELEVEANLAGVPEAWRQPDAQPPLEPAASGREEGEGR